MNTAARFVTKEELTHTLFFKPEYLLMIDESEMIEAIQKETCRPNEIVTIDAVKAAIDLLVEFHNENYTYKTL